MKFSIDDLIGGSKEAFDKLAGKAGSAINASKAYVEKAQISVKLKEKFYELGKLCYDMHKNDTDETGNMKKLIKEIKLLEAELELAEEASGKPVICGLCGAKNASDNTFCSKCGEKL